MCHTFRRTGMDIIINEQLTITHSQRFHYIDVEHKLNFVRISSEEIYRVNGNINL